MSPTATEIETLLDLAAPHIDILKFGWGTAYVSRKIKDKVAAFTLELYRAAAEGARLPERSRPDPLAVADADEYAGRYSRAEAELVLEATEGRLVLVRGGERIALERRGGDRFLVPDDDFALFLLAFRRDGDAVVEAWHGPDRYVRAGAAPEPLCEPAAEWHAYQGHYRAYNPWHSNFRVVGRGHRLDLIYPFGAEEPLAPLPDGSFRVGKDTWSPERIRFDAVVVPRKGRRVRERRRARKRAVARLRVHRSALEH